VHNCEHGAEEAHELHLTLKARTFHDRVEDLLSENGQLLASLQVGPFPRHEICVIGERVGEAAPSLAFQASIILRWMARITPSSAASENRVSVLFEFIVWSLIAICLYLLHERNLT
jgi:hypothetical protein